MLKLALPLRTSLILDHPLLLQTLGIVLCVLLRLEIVVVDILDEFMQFLKFGLLVNVLLFLKMGAQGKFNIFDVSLHPFAFEIGLKIYGND